MKRILLLFLLLAIPFFRDVALAADSTTSGSSIDLLNDEYTDQDQYDQATIPDPMEKLNRVFFEFNDKLYFWVLKPVSKGYSTVISYDLRQCIGNFFDNISSPISMLNNLLQGRFTDAWTDVSRFFINTTLGVYGFGDPATTAFNMPAKPADFGQTLGVWGIGEGIYICWPFLGPSNVRDSVGLTADFAVHPVSFIDMTMVERATYYVERRINTLSLNPNGYEELIKYSIDPYIASRQAFHEYRQKKIDRNKSKID